MPRVTAAGALVALALALSGCADMGGDAWTTAFADPAAYELYDCKQLEPVRKNLAVRQAELQGLMAKAQTGAGGAVVSELAYRNDYVAVRGQSRLAEDAWRKNNCHETPPPTPVAAASPTPNAKPAPNAKRTPNAKPAPASQSGSAVY
ncbi:MAG: twin-arginine translocation pathway signal [Bradyrhizobium sp.]|nr:twin-arginine translocation pathway signal [Bradyrhizobium sp.]